MDTVLTTVANNDAITDDIDDNALTDNITVDEVRNVCTSLNNEKSGVKIICLLFNLIIANEYIPKMFKESIIVPIFKGGNKDKLDRKNYRGITLQNTIGKVFDRILRVRYENMIREKCKISQL